MKKKIFTALLLLCTLSVAAEAQETKKSFTVEVSNTWNKAKADEPVVIKLSEINPQFRVRSAVVMNGNEEIPSQLDDLNGDRRPDELAFLVDLPAKGKKTLTITLSSAKSDKTYPARVYAEMLVSDKKGTCTCAVGNHSGHQQHLQPDAPPRSGFRIRTGGIPSVFRPQTDC